MGRYWATRRAGHGVPPAQPANPLYNLSFVNLTDGEFIEIQWAHQYDPLGTVTINIWHVTDGLRDFIFDISEASPSDDGKILGTQPSSGDDYQAELVLPGFANRYSIVQTAV